MNVKRSDVHLQNHARYSTSSAAPALEGKWTLTASGAVGMTNIVDRLIAIMLGRLEMDVDECISAYRELMKSIFEKKSSRLPMNWKGQTKSQFNSAKLERAIKNVIVSHKSMETDLFDDGIKRRCKV
jgi:hypothetical protein